MSQVSYGTITISDLTDITDVYLEYCMAEVGRTASEIESKTTWVSPERGWGITYPTWQSGYEIWIRQVQLFEGIDGDNNYILQTSIPSSTTMRIHGYNIEKRWEKQILSFTTTGNTITKTFQIPTGISFLRISYAKTGLGNTDLFQGSIVGVIGQGLIDESTNIDGYSIPSNGTPAINSTFNYTDYIPICIKKYGTPYLDTAVNQINGSIYEINTSVTGLDNRLKTFFWPGDSSYSGAFSVAKTSSDGLEVTDADTYGFNTRVATGLVSVGYNKIPLSEWGINEGLKMYYPILDNGMVVDNKLGMQLSAGALNLYNPTLSYKAYEGTVGNPQELRLYEYSDLDQTYILTQDTTFLSGKIYYENDIVKGLEIDNQGITIYDTNISPIIAIKQNIFSLGFNLTDTIPDDFDPYSESISFPYIIWKKTDNPNEESKYFLYEKVDDIFIRTSEYASYSLKKEIEDIREDILNNSISITNIQTDVVGIKSDIATIEIDLDLLENKINQNLSNINTNANNITINSRNITITNNRINKIKAYWEINSNNNHLSLIEEVL